jgi:HSP20 family protein
MRNNQFNSFVPFVQIVDDLLTRTFHDFSGGQIFRNNTPAMNVLNLEKEIRLEVAAPGLDKNDFKIQVEQNYLVVSAESKQENTETKEKFSRKEFSYHSFKRMYELPENINGESIAAKYENGILTINIPKAEPVNRAAKTINIE